MENKSHFKSYLQNGILYGIAPKNFAMDLTTAKELYNTRLQITKGKTYPIYFDLGNLSYVDKETREFLMNEARFGISAMAVVTNNSLARIFANAFLGFYKVDIPTKIFSDKEKAINWLQQYKSI